VLLLGLESEGEFRRVPATSETIARELDCVRRSYDERAPRKRPICIAYESNRRRLPCRNAVKRKRMHDRCNSRAFARECAGRSSPHRQKWMPRLVPLRVTPGTKPIRRKEQTREIAAERGLGGGVTVIRSELNRRSEFQRVSCRLAAAAAAARMQMRSAVPKIAGAENRRSPPPRRDRRDVRGAIRFQNAIIGMEGA